MIYYEEILTAFQKNKVEYLIVGGTAFNFYGGSRNTFDLDIIIELSDENLEKILKILKKQGYRSKLPVNPFGITDTKTREDWIKNKNLKALNFYDANGQGEVDLLIASPLSYQRAKKNKTIIKIHSLLLPVISIDDLIKMKKIAGRPIDELDVTILKKIKKMRRSK